MGERTLKIKKHISEILYSPEEIQIRLNYSGYSDDSRRNLVVENLQDGASHSCVGSRPAAGIGLDRFDSEILKNKSWNVQRGWGGENLSNLLITMPNTVHGSRRLLKNYLPLMP